MSNTATALKLVDATVIDIDEARIDTLNTLTEIEARLCEMASSPKKTWLTTYRLMRRVNDEQLFSPYYKSFSAWIKQQAKQMWLSSSCLWRYYKAGEVYDDYLSWNGLPVEDAVKVSPECFELAAKIAADNQNELDGIIGKLLRGSMTRTDLKALWQEKKAESSIKDGNSGVAQDSQNDVGPIEVLRQDKNHVTVTITRTAGREAILNAISGLLS